MRDYKGSRSYQEMLGFCEKMSLPAVKKVDQASLSSATANSRVSFLFVGNSGKSQV